MSSTSIISGHTILLSTLPCSHATASSLRSATPVVSAPPGTTAISAIQHPQHYPRLQLATAATQFQQRPSSFIVQSSPLRHSTATISSIPRLHSHIISAAAIIHTRAANSDISAILRLEARQLRFFFFLLQRRVKAGAVHLQFRCSDCAVQQRRQLILRLEDCNVTALYSCTCSLTSASTIALRSSFSSSSSFNVAASVQSTA